MSRLGPLGPLRHSNMCATSCVLVPRGYRCYLYISFDITVDGVVLNDKLAAAVFIAVDVTDVPVDVNSTTVAADMSAEAIEGLYHTASNSRKRALDN